MANVVDVTTPQTPCPACKQKHTDTNRGNTIYKSRLYCCDVWISVNLDDRVAMIQGVGGCVLCIDQTGDDM